MKSSHPFEKEVVQRLASIEANLQEHMKRTALLEKMVTPIIRIYHWCQVTGFIIATGGAVAALLKLFL